ncbi:MAG: hypothetical protein OEV64_08020, partial [Desulfobulbaceae bacterium]|nr:hypothetical protein [Desulfobulbaceae bacterium]
MTLKWKTIVFSGMALVVLAISLYIFQGYRDTNKRLIAIVSLLNSIRESAHIIGDESRYPHPDLESIKNKVDAMPLISQQFQEALRSKTKPAPYIDVEISFVRLGRIIDNMVSGQLIEEPILKQIHNETFKIEESAGLLLVVSLRQIETLQARSEKMIWTFYVIFVSYIFGTIYFLISMLTGPILSLSRQVAEISEGKRGDVSFQHRGDELGMLGRFIQKAISDLAGKNQQLNLEVLERKQAEEKYKQAAITLENVFNSANPISITNLDYELLHANKAYYDLWPNKADQGSEIKCYDSRPGPICNDDSCTLRQVIRTESTVLTETV